MFYFYGTHDYVLYISSLYVGALCISRMTKMRGHMVETLIENDDFTIQHNINHRLRESITPEHLAFLLQHINEWIMGKTVFFIK